ncbi:MAG: hypothetical protein IT346_03480 [Epsilonproteobacteria bacterium]|nr:hypothetical protein [Campylobacterota bacterium]
MKRINFINTLSPAEQHALAMWFYVSVLLTTIICITIVICQAAQLLTYTHLKHESGYWFAQQNSLNRELQKKEALVKKRSELEQQVAALKASSANPAIIHALEACLQAMHKTVFLHSLSLSATQATCTITCAKPAQALHYVRTLTQTALFDSVKLMQFKSSTSGDAHAVQAKIKGIFHEKL